MKTLIRLLLTIAIRTYRRLPASWKQPCPRDGETCSQRSLAAVSAGLGMAGILAVMASCTPQMGKHSPTCDFPG